MNSFTSGGPFVSIVRQVFSDLVQMFLVMSKLGTFNYVDHIFYSFLNCSHFPERFFIIKYSEKNSLSLQVSSVFWVQCLFIWVLFVWGVACWTQTWFYAQTFPWLGVMMMVCCCWVWRNCCRAFPVGVPLTFFRALFSVSMKHSACLLDLGWYGAIMIWLIWKISQNCVPLSNAKQSTPPNLANSL